MKSCKYRNCKKEFNGRANKKFCSIQCKRNELKYRQRIKIKQLNEKEVDN